ncbi:MAG: hypothetical protein M1828_000366 [Chrysothrix sp. TS-e1954]|nr:MAG: hypothetical protein M1828_000366 [Chrysothrix sp. TS-e1954]
MSGRPGPRYVGILALQGGFSEHILLLRHAFDILKTQNNDDDRGWRCGEIRTKNDLQACDALVVPGGESTTIALVAGRSDLLEALRHFVKVERRPTWGTCAGLVLLAEAANKTKDSGQELVGGLDVRVNRNHFGRQMQSFHTALHLPFLDPPEADATTQLSRSFEGVFIRAPVVEKLLPQCSSVQVEEAKTDSVIAPSRSRLHPRRLSDVHEVQVLATLPRRRRREPSEAVGLKSTEDNEIVAVLQDNVFGTSFHPELTNDARLHVWWLQRISPCIDAGRGPNTPASQGAEYSTLSD